MKKDVYISIKGSQAYEDDQNKMEVTTAGKFYDKDGKYYVSYVEGELTGMEKCNTTIKVCPDGTVTMMRHGQTNTHMIFEKDKCHIEHYETPYGDFTISVTANKIDVSLDENGGNIDIDYIMDINNVARSINGISLTIRA